MDRLDQLLLALYGMSGDPQSLRNFVEQYAERVGAYSGAVIIITDLAAGSGSMLCSARVDRVFSESYEAYYSKRNIYVRRAQSKSQHMVIATGEELCPTEELLRSEYYNDFLRPQKVHHSLGIAIAESGWHAHLGATRPEDCSPFDQEELRIARALAPHFAQAMLLHQRFFKMHRRLEAFEDLAARLPFGVLWLDRGGRVVEANRIAEHLIRTGDGLAVHRGLLQAALPGESGRVHALVASAISLNPIGSGGSMRVSRPSGAVSYSLTVIPLPGSESAAAMVIIADPQARHRIREHRLTQLYSLTPTEAVICAAMLEGKTLQEIAEEIGIALATVRTHFKRVLSKTETSRQSELMRVLMASLPLPDEMS